jgi:zinc transport system permease protein
MDALYAQLASWAKQGRLPALFEYAFLARGLLAVALVAPLLGGMSHLVVARRLAFFSAALGQAALTGLCIGLVLGEPLSAPYGGMFGFCLLAALAMVYVKRRAALPPDTLVGVFLALTLGLGICLLVAATKQFNIHQIEAVMFGSLLTVTDRDLLLLLVTTLVGFAILGWRYNALVLDSLSPDLAKVSGGRPAFDEYLFVVVLTAGLVVSLKIIGALMVEALVVVPAAAARNLSGNLRQYWLWSIAGAFVSGIGGLWVSTRFFVPSGGAVVLVLTAFFFVTLGVGSARSAFVRWRP